MLPVHYPNTTLTLLECKIYIPANRQSVNSVTLFLFAFFSVYHCIGIVVVIAGMRVRDGDLIGLIRFSPDSSDALV